MSNLTLYSLSAVLLTLAGGVIPLLRKWKDDHLHGFICLSAGVLIATAFLHLLPDAIERAPASQVGIAILISFVALFIIEKFVMLHPCEESHCDYHTIGWAAFFGMMIHTFFDGLALGAALRVESLGKIVFFAIMAHKIPSSFSLASILKKAKWSNGKILLALLGFGSIIPLCAITSSYLFQEIGDAPIGIAIAVSLGTFLYIATSDFLPEVHRNHQKRFRNLLSFLSGIAVVVILSQFGHHH